jgi:hypothetical protein
MPLSAKVKPPAGFIRHDDFTCAEQPYEYPGKALSAEVGECDWSTL